MSAKKWLCVFFITLFALCAALPVFNIITDPFGVFGDVFFKWYSFDETNNPRTAKITYLDEHFGEYDSYVIGCSSTSSFSVDTLNRYYNASFYNMIMYGADMLDVEQLCGYMIENYTVKNLVLNVYIDNGAFYGDESNPYTHSMLPRVDSSSAYDFYTRFLFATPEYGINKIKSRINDTWLSQPFDVFDERTGCYDKKKRDIEPIGNMSEYLEKYTEFVNYPSIDGHLTKTKQCMESIARIVTLCSENGVNLTVIAAPVYADYLACFPESDVVEFYTSLASVVDYWDFSYSTVSCEPRYFYDATHFRNSVGDMAIARMAGNGDVYIPDNFGYYVTAENAAEHAKIYSSLPAKNTDNYVVSVPVLMYHHISDTETGDATVSPDTFEGHMAALSENGYTAVTLDELRGYVNSGTSLPDKPVVITFDDGYESNYTYAYPILEKYGMKAAIFVIGTSVGHDTYKDTENRIIPHFSAEQGAEMVASGVIDIQSHTYDMHQAAAYESGAAREKIEMLDGEREEDFIASIRADAAANHELIHQMTGCEVFALAYPTGYMTDISAAVLASEGISVTFSTDFGVSTLVRGLPQSLLGMKRMWVNDISPDDLLLMITTALSGNK